jgi:hypothetical protein
MAEQRVPAWQHERLKAHYREMRDQRDELAKALHEITSVAARALDADASTRNQEDR